MASVLQKKLGTQYAFSTETQWRSFPWGSWGGVGLSLEADWLCLSLGTWSCQYVLRASFSSNIKACIFCRLQKLLRWSWSHTIRGGFQWGGAYSIAMAMSVISRLLTVLLGRRKERSWGKWKPILIARLLASLQYQPETSSVSFCGEGHSPPFPVTSVWLLPKLCQFSSQLRMSQWLV